LAKGEVVSCRVFLTFLILFSGSRLQGALDPKDSALDSFDVKVVGDPAGNKTFGTLIKESVDQKKDFFIVAVKADGSPKYDYFYLPNFLEHYLTKDNQNSRDAVEDFVLMRNPEFKVYVYSPGKGAAEYDKKNFTLRDTYKSVYDFIVGSEKLGKEIELDEQFLNHLKQEIFSFNRTPFSDAETTIDGIKLNLALYYIALLYFPAYINSKNYSESTKKLLKDEADKLIQELKKSTSKKTLAATATLTTAMQELEGKTAAPEAKPEVKPEVKKDDTKKSDTKSDEKSKDTPKQTETHENK